MRTAPVLLTAVGGLLLAAGTVSDWVVRLSEREVGGVPLLESEAVAGTVFAGAGLPLGLAAVAVSVALVVSGLLRRAGGAVALLIGVVAVAVVVVGLVRAAGEPGDFAPGAIAAASGAVAIGVGGALALARPAPPRLGSRYTVDGEGGDDEWRLAAGDQDEPV